MISNVRSSSTVAASFSGENGGKSVYNRRRWCFTSARIGFCVSVSAPRLHHHHRPHPLHHWPLISISSPSSPSPAHALHHRPLLSITDPFSPSLAPPRPPPRLWPTPCPIPHPPLPLPLLPHPYLLPLPLPPSHSPQSPLRFNFHCRYSLPSFSNSKHDRFSAGNVIGWGDWGLDFYEIRLN